MEKRSKDHLPSVADVRMDAEADGFPRRLICRAT